MSTNFFAALDDSGDEGPPKVVIPAAPKESKKQGEDKPKKKVFVEPSTVDERKRPNQNDRNTKYGRGGRAPVRDGKRAYERRSGTGRGKEIKKGGGGARNWGNDKNEARQAQGHVADEAEVTAPPPEVSERELEEAEGAAEVEKEEVPVKEEEPQDTTLSYGEYLEQKKQQQAESALFAPVKERQVENEFAKLKPKEAVEEDFLVLGGGKQKKTKAKTKEIQTVQVGFRVEPNATNAPSGRGRGRGGGRSGDREWRDGGRDGGGRGGGRSGDREGRDGGRGVGRSGDREWRDGGRDGGRGGAERGPRGSGRGGGRGGGRHDSGRDSGRGRGRSSRGGGGLNVNDTQAFPSL